MLVNDTVIKLEDNLFEMDLKPLRTILVGATVNFFHMRFQHISHLQGVFL